MRRKQRKTDDESAWDLLRRAPEHFLATVTPEGEPVLRCLNGVLVDDWLLFHGAIAGEKSDCLGQPAVATAQEVIADIPSTFVDSQKACPATTYYRSVQAKGVLLKIESPELKARMLQALMEKLQPEGGHVPLRAEEPLYQKDYKSVLVFGMRVSSLTGKANLGQDKPPEFTRNIVENLWRRGKERDLQAIAQILEQSPLARPERFALSVEDRRFEVTVSPSERDAEAHARLLSPEYWRAGCEFSAVLRSIQASSAWVGLTDEEGILCAAGRALADGDWAATIYDVVVAPEVRGRGLGRRLMELLLEHPRVRHCTRQRLGTRDRGDFYEKLGFKDAERLAFGFPTRHMAREGAARSERR